MLAAAGLDPEDAAVALIACALVDVPRERFVPLDRVSESVMDMAVPLDTSGLASVSAMHAYLRAFAAAGISPGRRVVDLGSGSGYGAALLAALVGDQGRVRAIEIDPQLAALARTLLAPCTTVDVREGDALDVATWPTRSEGFDCAIARFALSRILEVAAEALGEGGVLVAPMDVGRGQELMRFELRHGAWEGNRSARSSTCEQEHAPRSRRQRRR